MIKFHKLTLPALALAVFLTGGLTGCEDRETPPEGAYGTVATVNGRGISLQHLQAKHDFNHLSWSASAMPSADD